MNPKSKESGFSFLEVIFAIIIGGMATLISFEVYSRYVSKTNQMQEELEVSNDFESGQRIILKDLKALDPCFGQCQAKDDSGKAFFDYYPDVPEELLTNGGERKITLAKGKLTEFKFFLLDSSADPIPTLIYDPVAAYTIGPTPSDFNTPATITFSSLNKDSWISTLRPGYGGGGGSGYWRNDQILMLDTPVAFRPANAAGDINIAPRSMMYAGIVNNSSLDRDTELTAQLNYQFPLTPTLEIDSADTFLRYLPPVGGGQPLVRLRPVKLVKYSFEPMSSSPTEKLGRLRKSVYKSNKYSQSFILADKVSEVVFWRKSVTSKAVFFTISRGSKAP